MKNLNKKLLFISISILAFPLFVRADKQCPSISTEACSCDWWNIVCWLNCIWGILITFPIKLPFLIFAAIGIVLALVGGIFLLIVQEFAKILIDTSIAATSNLGVSIQLIQPIKEFSLHLIYIFLLIIGIATIFRIAEYQAKKALVPLIIVALLINFTGPITQEVVNIGNSLTNYFLTQIKNYNGGSLALITMGTFWQSLLDGVGALGGIFVADGSFYDCLPENLTIIGILSSISFVMAIFFFAAAIILGVFGLVFLARIVFIYLLYIVAPIAFATAAFGRSIPGEIKSIFVGPLNFDGWWKDILEWSFIGVALAIWLFLAVYILNPDPTINNEPPLINITPISDNALTSLGSISLEQSQKIIDPINKLIKYLAPLIALYIGVKTAPGMMGQMAQQAFNMAKTAVTTGAIILGTAATAGIAAGAGAIGGAAGAAKAAGAGRLGTLGAGIKAVPSAIKTGFSTAARTTLGKGLPELVKPIPKEIREEIAAVPWVARREAELVSKEEEAEKLVKKIKERGGYTELKKLFKNPRVSQLVKEKAHSELLKDNALSEKDKEDKDFQKIALSLHEKALKRGNKKSAESIELAYITSLSEELESNAKKYGIFTNEDIQKYGTYKAKILAGVKTEEDIKQLQKNWYKELKDKEKQQVLLWKGNRVGLAVRTTPEFAEEYSKMLEEEKDWVLKNNPDAFYYTFTTPARILGIHPPADVTLTDIRVAPLVKKDLVLTQAYNYKREIVNSEKTIKKLREKMEYIPERIKKLKEEATEAYVKSAGAPPEAVEELLKRSEAYRIQAEKLERELEQLPREIERLENIIKQRRENFKTIKIEQIDTDAKRSQIWEEVEKIMKERRTRGG